MQGLKLFICVTLSVILAFSLFSCDKQTQQNDQGITVVATLFPQYDFARAILGEKGSVVLLLTPGSDSHNFELTPSDIRTINKCDLLLYTGPNMEIWMDNVIGSISSNVKTVSLASMIGFSEAENHQHNGHDYTADPHIWTNPKNAIKMLKVIYDTICTIDPKNVDYYSSNYQKYLAEIETIDQAFTEISQKADDSCLYFSGKFAFAHFVEEYGFKYNAPFNSCSDVQIESLASVKKLISDLKDNNIKYIFYEELSNNSILETIISETGVSPLLFHSAHNLSKDEFDGGVTYVSLMQTNVDNLRKALING